VKKEIEEKLSSENIKNLLKLLEKLNEAEICLKSLQKDSKK
jgi:Ca2+-binding EF-hand superfamily protein